MYHDAVMNIADAAYSNNGLACIVRSELDSMLVNRHCIASNYCVRLLLSKPLTHGTIDLRRVFFAGNNLKSRPAMPRQRI